MKDSKDQTLQEGAQYKTFAKQIANLLVQFERTREWADIGNWLAKLQPKLVSKKFKNVPHKVRLSKRLAQCLSPGIPSTIHSNALNIYKIILKNFGNKTQIIPLFSIGLFPFFQYSSTNLKFELLNIFQEFFINSPQCLQMITSLINTLLASFIENNDQLIKKIHAFCDKIAQRYGRVWVNGAVWINILKSPKVRSAGYKFLMKQFKDLDKNIEDAQNEQIKKQGLTQYQDKQKQQKQVSIIVHQVHQINQPEDENKQKKVRKKSQYIQSGDQGVSNEDIEQETQIQKIIKRRSRQSLGIRTTPSITNQLFPDDINGQIQQQMIQKLKNFKEFTARFPHFSTLVMNAICQSLQSPSSNNLIRRSTLDLIIAHLNQDKKEQIPQKDFVMLLRVMLEMLNFKQYSLTRRVYTYLFGPPNMEGLYVIQPQKQQFQIKILKLALQKMLRTQKNQQFSSDYYAGSLKVIHIMLKDNESLQPIILPLIAYRIIKFLRISNLSEEFVYQFYNDIIQPNSQIFMRSIEDQTMIQNVQKRPPQARQTVLTIQNFYNLKRKIKDSGKEGAITDKQIIYIIESMVKYLLKTKCSYQRLSIQIIDFCLRLQAILSKDQKFSENTINCLDQLIKLKPVNTVYSKLLTLHPLPAKQYLLPYINQTTLAIVCIKNLLAHDAQNFSIQQKKQLFFAIFQLFQLRIWQDQAVSFTNIFKDMFPDLFLELIEKISPSQWITYWNKMNGDIDSGLTKMLQKLQSESDKEDRQKIRKWLQDSKNMPQKILIPVYKLMKQTSNKDIDIIYKMIRRIIKAQKQSFSHFLFKQREKFLMPLLDRIFSIFETEDQKLKVLSVQMLQFIAQNVASLDEKLIFLSITFKKTITSLKQTQQTQGKHERQIQIVQYFMSTVDTFRSFKGNEQRLSILEQIIQGQGYFPAMAQGMRLSKVPYLRTLYVQLLQRSIQIFIFIQAHPQFISRAIKHITEKLFIMVGQSNASSLEEIISGIQSKNKKIQQSEITSEQLTIQKSQLNVQKKYAQVIELWNCISFLFKICMENKIFSIPILDLLTNMIHSFPFTLLKYEQISNQFLNQGYKDVQWQINNVSGLKKEVLSIFQNIWKNYQSIIIDYLIEKGDPRILLHSGINPLTIFRSLSKGTYMKKILKYHERQDLKIPKGVLHYNFQILLQEDQLCYFIYIYILYCDFSQVKDRSQEIFEAMISLLKNINHTSHTQTKLWILEIIYCFTMKFSIKQIFNRHSKFRSQIHSLTNNLLQEITSVISKKMFFTFKNQIKSSFFHKLTKEEFEQEPSEFDFARNFPPTINNQEFLYQSSMQNLGDENMSHAEDNTKQFIFSKQSDLSQSHFQTYLSVVAMKTYTYILIPLLNRIYDHDHHKIASICKDNASQMFQTYYQKEEFGKIYQQAFAQFLRQLTNQQAIKSEVIKGLRKNIMDIYMNDDFFRCTKNTLNHWVPVVDACTEHYDLISELISKQGLFEGLFSKKNKATDVQIKNFERVCYLIFCGKVDKYEKKLRVVLQSLSRVMKAQNPSPALLILILFCLRILLMRLSPATMSRMFRSIWPSLIALLIQIFSKKRFEKCINLRLAALKTIELVHALDLEQFNIHKWIFIFDYFGIKIEKQTEQQKNKILQQSVKVITPFKYKPILCRAIPEESLKFQYQLESQKPKSKNYGRRRIIIQQTTVDTEQQLQKLAYQLIEYLVQINQNRVSTSREDLQDVIETDLISLDEYIYNVK